MELNRHHYVREKTDLNELIILTIESGIWALSMSYVCTSCADTFYTNLQWIKLITVSRQTFAFSRDGALPFSKLLYRINHTTGTPVACVIFCAFIAMLFGLLTFAGPAAAGAVFTMGVVCIFITFSIPIAARHLGGREFVPGPFTLGKLVCKLKTYYFLKN